MKAVNIGLLGLGTVGSGVITVLQRNCDEISRRAGREIRVTAAAVRDLSKERSIDTSSIRLTTDPLSVVRDPQVDIIVELMGGEDAALDAVSEALENNKHVVTANKALIAIHGNTLFGKAQEKGLMVAFESAVAGGIPIIKSIREGLTANRIEWLAGIINGTSNYILTEMEQGGRSFQDVLSEAQALGYAEADPAFDIEGTDAAHKLTILASIAFGMPLQFHKAYVEGIEHIASEDIQYASELGYRIKHLGIAKRNDDGIELRVHPTLIPKPRLIANVDGVMNAVLVQADAVGPTLYYGAGAGSEPTASAVIADLVDVVRSITADPENRVPHLAFQADTLGEPSANLAILPIDQATTSYYLRIHAVNRPGVLAQITRIFGDAGISIETILQKGSNVAGDNVSIIILTQATQERFLVQAIKDLESLEAVDGSVVRLRLESLS